MSVELWIEDHVPDKPTLSRDAVEILIRLAWKAAKEEGRQQEERRRQDDLYGDV